MEIFEISRNISRKKVGVTRKEFLEIFRCPHGNSCQGQGVMQLNTPTRLLSMLGAERAVSVSAGAFHSLAITADGAVFTWGKGEDACLGHGDDLSNQLLPKKVEAWPASS